MSKSKAKNEAKKQAKKVLLLLGNWATEVNSWQEVSELEETIDYVYHSFLASEAADSNEARNSAMMLHKQQQDLLTILKKINTPVSDAIQTKVNDYFIAHPE